MASAQESTQLYTYTIRPATQADASALSDICLLTADAGKDAQTHHAYRELPGLYYSVPYVHIPGTGGFVLVRRAGEAKGDLKEAEEVVGYSLYALDTLDFCARMEKEWFPPLRVKYPLPSESNSDNGSQLPVYEVPLKEADLAYVKRIHKPDPPNSACIAFCPAHMVNTHLPLRTHINIDGLFTNSISIFSLARNVRVGDGGL